MNAKVDYTLLDRWRHSHAWWARKRLEHGRALERSEAARSAASLDDDEQPAATVVHMPLVD